MSSRDQKSSFHVLFHRMACQVGAGDEAHVAIGDRDFGVNPPIRKRAALSRQA
jgi:hypothetical protein